MVEKILEKKGNSILVSVDIHPNLIGCVDLELSWNMQNEYELMQNEYEVTQNEYEVMQKVNANANANAQRAISREHGMRSNGNPVPSSG